MKKTYLIEFGERLKAARQECGISREDTAKYVGISRDQYGRYERGEGDLGIVKLSICISLLCSKKSSFNIERLISGLGSMTTSSSAHESIVFIPWHSVNASEESVIVPFLEAEASHCTYAFKKDWFLKRNLNANNLSIVQVKGGSMLPRLNDGDFVLVNHAETNVQSGKAYVIRLYGELLVKYAQWVSADEIQFSSENPLYSPIIVNLSKSAENEVAIIGLIVNSSHEW